MRGWLVLALVLSSLLTGCAGPEPPPTFELEEVRYWFEGDYLIVNLTIRNQANYTPGITTKDPSLWVTVEEWLPRAKNPRPEEPGTSLTTGSHHTISLTLSDTANEPPRERYYDPTKDYWRNFSETISSGMMGPVAIHPNETFTAEFMFFPDHRLEGEEGYYTVDIGDVTLLPSNEDASFEFRSGCFNHNTSEFYGVADDGPDCYWYDQERSTETGVALFGEEGAEEPRMIHDPPANVTGAH